jgi:uncharacterized protein (DUF302 family)
MKRILATSLLLLASLGASADPGIVAKASRYPVSETIARLEAVLKAKGITVFARVDHAGEAEKAGLKMRPTQLLVFGNPKAGTPMMVAAPSLAIDLPLKALAWEDENGKVWLGYNDPAMLRKRHGIAEDASKPLGAVAGLVEEALK